MKLDHYIIHRGSCLDVLPTLDDCSVDAVVTDPPYGLSKEPDMAEVMRHWLAGDDYTHTGKGFMGKSWDSFVPGPAVWKECFRVLKPGGHLLAFFGSRTYDMGVLAIRLAGFEIRDQIGWVYGSGFPKNLDVSKAIDKAGGHPWADFAELLDRLIKSSGFNYTSLDEALGIPSAGSNSCYWVRTDERGGLPPRRYYERLKQLLSPPPEFTDLYDKAEREVVAIERRRNAPSGIVGAGRESVEVERKITSPATEAAKQWDGWGTALKPALEPIVVARKPLNGTVAANVLEHGTGALNIDGCRVESGADYHELKVVQGGNHRHDVGLSGKTRQSEFRPAAGRWPANLIHDGSDEVLAMFPSAPGQQGPISSTAPSEKTSNVYGKMRREGEASADIENNGPVGFKMRPGGRRIDAGSAARFFYCAKASKADRNAGLDSMPDKVLARSCQAQAQAEAKRGNTVTAENGAFNKARVVKNNHPTVKPTELMRYLCRLVTPPGGIVVDPFMGSGSTGRGAVLEGFYFIGIERDLDENGEPWGMVDIATARIEDALALRETEAEAEAQQDLFHDGVAI